MHPGWPRSGSHSTSSAPSSTYDDLRRDTGTDEVVEQCLIVNPSVVGDASLFLAGGVESALPYSTSMLRQEIGPYSGFMIDEERIIGLPVSVSCFRIGQISTSI